MTRPIVCIVNVETQEEVFREMNDAEYEQHLLNVAAYEKEAAERAEKEAQDEAKAAEKAAAKAEALAALGLSQEVINLLAD